jgi:hypothetical protein
VRFLVDPDNFIAGQGRAARSKRRSAALGTGAGSVSRTTLDAQSWVRGDSSYIGTEVDLGLTWRFAPSVAFELQGGAYLFAGDALATAELLNGVHTRREPEDAYMGAARVRFAF